MQRVKMYKYYKKNNHVDIFEIIYLYLYHIHVVILFAQLIHVG